MQDALGSAMTNEHAPQPPMLPPALPPLAESPPIMAANVATSSAPPAENEMTNGLGNHVRKCHQGADNFKVRDIQPTMAKCLRLRKSEYDSAQLKAFGDQNIAPAFFPITATKCSHAAAWFREILLMGDRPYGLQPSAVPQLPQDAQESIAARAVRRVMAAAQIPGAPPPTPEAAFFMAGELRDEQDAATMAEAQRRAKRMEDHISNEMRDSGFDDEFEAFIDDLCTYPTAFLMDEVRMVKTTKWDGQQLAVVDVPMLCPVRVSPWDAYPSPLCGRTNDGYMTVRRYVTKEQLCQYMNVPSYNNAAIRKVLDEQPSSTMSLRPYDIDKLMGEDKDTLAVGGSADERIELIIYFGAVKGEWLLEWDDKFTLPGGKPVDADVDYPVTCIIAGNGNCVIKAMLNPDPLGRWPIYAASFYANPGSIWGEALPIRMEAMQRTMNSAFRNMIDNINFASSPQMEAEMDRILPQSVKSVYSLIPKRVIQTKPAIMSQSPAVRYQEITNHARELISAINAFLDYVDELTGIPRFIAGENRGAPETASGLQMLMNAASKTIRQAIGRVGRQVVAQMIERRVVWYNLYGKDAALKGDCDVQPSGVMAILVRDQVAQKRDSLLQLVFTNPAAQAIVGPVGMARMLREKAKEAGWYDLMPTDSDVQARADKQAAQPPSAAPGDGPANPPTPQPAAAATAPQPAMTAA